MYRQHYDYKEPESFEEKFLDKFPLSKIRRPDEDATRASTIRAKFGVSTHYDSDTDSDCLSYYDSDLDCMPNYPVRQASYGDYGNIPSQRTTSNQPSGYRNEYYNQYLPLILEDARASLAAGLELVDRNKKNRLQLKLKNFRIPRGRDAAILTTLEVDGRLPLDEDCGTACIGMLVTYKQSHRFLAFATAKENTIWLRFFAYKNIKDDLRNGVIPNQGIFHAFVLGGVITHKRMYEICVEKPITCFEQEYIQGEILSRAEPRRYQFSRPGNLNESQWQAVGKFCNLEQGMQLLQGPPGTGKTTTIIELINALVRNGEKVLVCAPSNKAVQVIASRFLSQYPEALMTLVGVEKKVPPNLRQIFIHTWAKDKLERLNQLLTILKKANLEEYTQGFQDFKDKAISIVSEIIKYLPNVSDYLNQIKRLRLEQHNVNPYMFSYSMRQTPRDDFVYIIENIIQNLSSQNHISDNISPIEAAILANSKVIFATLSVCGRRLMQELRGVNALIVDEAAQATEAETLIPFRMHPNKCLLVGDTKQLPATIISELAVQKHFNWSMMWRLLEECHQPFDMLTIQYRMHPEIRMWPSRNYYQNRLQDSPSIGSRTSMQIQFGPYSFINVSRGQESRIMHTYANRAEAEYVINILQYLRQLNINIQEKVGVITFYAGQAELITRIIRERRLGNNIKVSTVDGFQGEENDIIIISFVRSSQQGGIGFLRDFRRLNVAVTRAKHNLIMLGNILTLLRGNSDVTKLVQDAIDREKVFEPNAFPDIFPDSSSNRARQRARPRATPRRKAHAKTEAAPSSVATRKTNPQQTGRFYKARRRGATQESADSNPNNYKTILCKFFKQGNCSRGSSCDFAHGKSELRRR